MTIDVRETQKTRRRYQRVSTVYNLMEILPEQRYKPWRERLWSLVNGPKVLEVGVGTGKNLPYYPSGKQVTGIDLTPGMLEQAVKRAADLNLDVDLQIGDAQALDFHEDTFDSVVTTFVFCSVPDPLLGLAEIVRVVKPAGQVILMDHVRSGNPVLGILMDALNPVVVRITGANINRRTVENVREACLVIDSVETLGMGDIFKLIIAHRE